MNIFESHKNKKLFEERIFAAFPKEYREDVKVVIEALSYKNILINSPSYGVYKVKILMSEDSISLKTSTTEIFMPARTYFNIPKESVEELLTKNQKMIMNCIFSRYHDGYERQRRVSSLLESSTECAAIYLISLIGDYVIEILNEIKNGLKEENLYIYRNVIKLNQKYWASTKSRLISYWNEYYRYPDCPKLENYLGIELIKIIEGI